MLPSLEKLIRRCIVRPCKELSLHFIFYCETQAIVTATQELTDK